MRVFDYFYVNNVREFVASYERLFQFRLGDTKFKMRNVAISKIVPYT